MFKICQGTCFCAANSDGNIRDARETVLYCFGEVDIDIVWKKSYFKRMFQVVLKKDSLRGEEASAKISSQQTLDEYHLQLAQLVITFLLIFLVLIVLLLIRFSDTHMKMIVIINVTMFRKGLLRIIIQMRRIVRVLEYQGQSDTLKRDKEYLR